MYILEVIPISKGISKETFSYFSSFDIPVGSIIKVPLRKRIISALVIDKKNIEESKAEIKSSDYSLKKISSAKYTNLLSKHFIEASEETASYYVGSTGAVLNTLIPNVLLENIDKINFQKIEGVNSISSTKPEKFVIQSNDEDRYAQYKSIIREEFAKNSSVFFCLPTIQDIKKTKEFLHKGIEPYTFVLHSLMNKKDIVETINKILTEKHPLLIIATGGFLAIPRNDIKTIILDKENSRIYKTQSRPYIDIRKFVEIYSSKIKARIIFGDLLLRTDTIWRQKKNEFVELVPLKFRSLTTSDQKIIDMRNFSKEENNEETNNKKFSVLSEELKLLIKENIENNEHMFIFVGRRGLSPSTVCADCGNIVKCNSCGAHTVLHSSNSSNKTSDENFFLCHKCGERRSSLEKCVNCGGWRLTTLGIGAELVMEEIKKLYPKGNVMRLDTDIAKTHKQAEKIAEKFYDSPEGILVGTEMALLYLTEKIENTAVVSIDAFFSIPDFRINERILNVLLKIKSITDKHMLIQTRDISQKVFSYATRGNLVDFYKEEIEDREKLNFPPFTTLIKISISGTKDKVMKIIDELQHIISPHEIDVFPAFIPQSKGKFGINGIIKIPQSKWIDNELFKKLKSLPIEVTVNVDPDSLI